MKTAGSNGMCAADKEALRIEQEQIAFYRANEKPYGAFRICTEDQ